MSLLDDFSDERVALTDPLQLARALWNVERARALPPRRFQTLFDRVYQNAANLETLWQLGGAANDYLRGRPDAIDVPIELPRRLLASDHVDARVIGLKLLNRCSPADSEIVGEIVRALQRDDGYEDYGGFYELGCLIDRRPLMGYSLPASVVEVLISAIQAFVADKEENEQRLAEARIHGLRPLAR